MDNQSSQAADSSQIYLPVLRDSIDHFLLSHKNGATDFSHFTPIFSRLLQSAPDPPLEIIWFYSAVTFHSAKFTSGGSSGPILRVKDLFQLLVSCSGSGSSAKRIAVLAPVLYELYSLVVDQNGLRKDVESLLEILISYISICCGGNMDEEGESEGLSPCFVDLVRVWVLDEFGKDARGFFPVISDGVRDSIGGGCGLGFVAGAVMCEAFLLRLCLKFDNRVLRAELERDMRDWIIRTLSGFRSFYFFNELLQMLLDPVLPVTSLLKFEDEVLLREVLYDAIITQDCTFFNAQTITKFSERRMKHAAVMLLLVVDCAIRFVRENGDNTKANTYMNALSMSCLPAQLFEWVTRQIGTGEVTRRPAVSSPAALIKWLLIVEDLGVKIFDCDILKLRTKEVVCKSRIEYELPVFKVGTEESSPNGIFSSAHDREMREDKQSDTDSEMVDSADAPLVSFTCPVYQTTTEDTRKRKGTSISERATPVKFLKFRLHENTARCRFFPQNIEDKNIEVDKLIFCGDAFEMEH